MPRERLEVADIFRAHGAAWRRAQAGHLIPRTFGINLTARRFGLSNWPRGARSLAVGGTVLAGVLSPEGIKFGKYIFERLCADGLADRRFSITLSSELDIPDQTGLDDFCVATLVLYLNQVTSDRALDFAIDHPLESKLHFGVNYGSIKNLKFGAPILVKIEHGHD
jgi:hypothetical protein